MRRLKKKNLLITGLPGMGKTTLIKNVVEALKDLRPVPLTLGNRARAFTAWVSVVAAGETVRFQSERLPPRRR